MSNYPKYRLEPWLNIQTGEKHCGIQRQDAKGERYRNVCCEIRGNLRALVFVNESRAAAVMDSIVKGKKVNYSVGLVPLP